MCFYLSIFPQEWPKQLKYVDFQPRLNIYFPIETELPFFFTDYCLTPSLAAELSKNITEKVNIKNSVGIRTLLDDFIFTAVTCYTTATALK